MSSLGVGGRGAVQVSGPQPARPGPPGAAAPACTTGSNTSLCMGFKKFQKYALNLPFPTFLMTLQHAFHSFTFISALKQKKL